MQAGQVLIDAAGAGFKGIFAKALTGSSGQTGSVLINASEGITLSNGGSLSIQNDATVAKPEGLTPTTLSVSAPSIALENGGQITAASTGNVAASNIQVNFTDQLLLNSSSITTSAYGAGNAGRIEVSARGSVSLSNGGRIDSNTYESGNAGSITVRVGQVLIDATGAGNTGIFAKALKGSGGQTGSVLINSSEGITLSNGGSVSIENEATVAKPEGLTPTTLSVSAPSIALENYGQITAASTGNVAASNIQVNFTDQLLLNSSSITTSANAGNGGAIRVQGGNLLVLDNSQITTSVLGASGNGGDIGVAAGVLVMNTGFIQANTAARAASGGDVLIDVASLVPSGNTLTLGSRSAHTFTPGVFGYNVIEAAAPDGISGNVQVSSPSLDLAGALRGLSTAAIDLGALGRDPCRVGAGSSLTPLGRGGLPPTAGGLIRPEPNVTARSTGRTTDVLAQTPAPLRVDRGCQ